MRARKLGHKLGRLLAVAAFGVAATVGGAATASADEVGADESGAVSHEADKPSDVSPDDWTWD